MISLSRAGGLGQKFSDGIVAQLAINGVRSTISNTRNSGAWSLADASENIGLCGLEIGDKLIDFRTVFVRLFMCLELGFEERDFRRLCLDVLVMPVEAEREADDDNASADLEQQGNRKAEHQAGFFMRPK